MKIVTLMAGIALIVSAAFALYNFVVTYSKIGMRAGPGWVLSQGTWIFAQGVLVAFFFVLYARQRN